MIPSTFDASFTRLRDGARWRVRLRAAGREIVTSPTTTPLEAITRALARLGEAAVGVPDMERPRAVVQEGGR
jgi:hypothetical protein